MNYSISPCPNTKRIEAQQGGDIENFLVSGIKPASVGGICTKAILIIFSYYIHYIIEEFYSLAPEPISLDSKHCRDEETAPLKAPAATENIGSQAQDCVSLCQCWLSICYCSKIC